MLHHPLAEFPEQNTSLLWEPEKKTTFVRFLESITN